MRLRVSSSIALVLLAVAIVPGPARGDTITTTPIFFDGFESDKSEVLNSTLKNWNVVSGSIDILASGNFCGPAGRWSNCLDLDGTGKSAGTIQSKDTFALDPGFYRLSFDLAGSHRYWTDSPTNTVTVSFGSYFSEDITLARLDNFQTFTRDISVPAVGLGNITFHHHGKDWIGLLLDDVRLERLTITPDPPPDPEIIPTPEPGTLLLCAGGLTLLLLRLRKQR